MSKQDSLYTLIKSMDKHEKRFFKLYTKLYNHNKIPTYVHLFDIFDHQKDFEPNILNEKIEQTFPKKNISQIKQYLREAIYNSLKLYHKKHNPTVQEYETLSTVNILIKKNLLAEAEKILLKMKDEAQKKEKFDLLININNELININYMRGQRNLNLIKQRSILSKEKGFYIAQQQQCIAIANVGFKLAQLNFAKDRLAEAFQENLQNILDQELLVMNPDTFQSITPQYLYYNILSIFYKGLSKETQYLETLEKVKALLNLPPLQYRFIPKCVVLASLLQAYTSNKRYDDFHQTLKEFDDFLKKHPQIQSQYLYWRYLRELEFYYFNPKESIPIKHLQEIENICTQANHTLLNPTNKKGLLLALTRHYFIRQDYHQAQHFLLKITLQHKTLVDEFYFIDIHLMSIICYYEMNIPKIAQSHALALQRKLKKQDNIIPQLMKLLKILIQFIRLDKESSKHSSYLKKILDIIQDAPKEHHSLLKEDLYFIQLWIEDKLAI